MKTPPNPTPLTEKTPPRPVAESMVPAQYFRTLCQNPRCRCPLGGFHIPQVGATVLYACHKCSHVSIFRVDTYGISVQLQDRHGRVLTT